MFAVFFWGYSMWHFVMTSQIRTWQMYQSPKLLTVFWWLRKRVPGVLSIRIKQFHNNIFVLRYNAILELATSTICRSLLAFPRTLNHVLCMLQNVLAPKFYKSCSLSIQLNEVDRRSRTSTCDNVGNHADQAEQRLEMWIMLWPWH